MDAGAGVGSLTAAFIAELCSRKRRPEQIQVVAYEIDSVLAGDLTTHFSTARPPARTLIELSWKVVREDFIDDAARILKKRMFEPVFEFDRDPNPPYKKITSDSQTRGILREIGIETSNLYAGFLAVVLRLLASNGELTAITPRSFCNGLYFKLFREGLSGNIVAHADSSIRLTSNCFQARSGAPKKRHIPRGQGRRREAPRSMIIERRSGG